MEQWIAIGGGLILLLVLTGKKKSPDVDLPPEGGLSLTQEEKEIIEVTEQSVQVYLGIMKLIT